MSILELLQHIVNEPAPKLTPEGRFPSEAEKFVDSCLLKDPDTRPTPKELLVSIQDVIKRVRHGVLIETLRTSRGCRQRRRHRSTWLLGQQLSECHISSQWPLTFRRLGRIASAHPPFRRRRLTHDPRCLGCLFSILDTVLHASSVVYIKVRFSHSMNGRFKEEEPPIGSCVLCLTHAFLCFLCQVGFIYRQADSEATGVCLTRSPKRTLTQVIWAIYNA